MEMDNVVIVGSTHRTSDGGEQEPGRALRSRRQERAERLKEREKREAKLERLSQELFAAFDAEEQQERAMERECRRLRDEGERMASRARRQRGVWGRLLGV